MTLENAVNNNGGLKQYASSVVLKSPRKMAAAFALSVVQDSIQRLDSCQQQDDYSSLVLRLEYLNRTIVNSGELPGAARSSNKTKLQQGSENIYWPTWSPFFSSRRRATVLPCREWIYCSTNKRVIGGVNENSREENVSFWYKDFR